MAFAVPAAEVADAAAGKAAATAAGKKTAAKKTAPAPAKQSTPAKQSAPAGAGKSAPALSTKERAGGRKVAAWAFSGNRSLLTAEYIACVAVLGAGTLLAPQGSKDGAVRGMVKFTALSALFFLLALAGSAGKGASRAATALGALITAAYLFTSSDVHNVANWVSVFFSPTGDVTGTQPGGSGPTLEQQAQSVQDVVGGAAAVAAAAGAELQPGSANGQTPITGPGRRVPQ